MLKQTAIVLSILGSLVMGGACGDDDGPGDASFDGGTDTGGDVGDDSTMDTGIDIGPTGPCGDGSLDVGEECDDGNEVDTDACRNDCRRSCGDGEQLGDETCDTGIASGAGSCPTECDDADPCTMDVLTGMTCQTECIVVPITARIDGDMCCPAGATADEDSDCGVECGNGMVETGESCDTAIAAGAVGACPVDCDDAEACTADSISGSACTARCVNEEITTAMDGDMCCPAGATSATDDDCSMTCGNGMVEAGEQCDTAIAAGAAGACPTTCNDGMACTTDTLFSGGTCSARCRFAPITTPTDGDMCCPSGATALTDNDCTPVCGNGTREPPEQCDDGNITTGDGCDGMCRSEVVSTAFRFDSIALVDPHVFVSALAGLLCFDATGQTNTALQDSIDMGDLNVLQVFRPLMPSAATSPTDVFTDAMCTVPSAGGMPDYSGAMCMPGGTAPVMATATNQAAGSCYMPGAGTLTPRYMGVVNNPTGPCYSAMASSVTVSLAGSPITLRNVRVSASYAGDRLLNGVLAGFITFSEARATTIDLNRVMSGLGMRTLFELLQSNMAGDACNPGGTPAMADDSDDFDGVAGNDGWWFYLNFTATEPASFTE